jgi:hypothetical protein
MVVIFSLSPSTKISGRFFVDFTQVDDVLLTFDLEIFLCGSVV